MKFKIIVEDGKVQIKASQTKEYGLLGRQATASIDVQNDDAAELILEAVAIVEESIGPKLRQKAELAAMKSHVLAIELGEE